MNDAAVLPSAFDIGLIATAPDLAAAMEVLHPKTQQPLKRADGEAVTIMLLGIDSDRVSQYQADERNRVLAARSPIITTAEKEDVDTVDLLVVATAGWSFDTMDGKPFPCNPTNARRFYSDTRFRSIRQQALTFIYTRGNFIKR